MSVEAWSTIVRRYVHCIPALSKALYGQIVTKRAVKAMMCSLYSGVAEGSVWADRYRKGGQGDDVFIVSRLCAKGSVWADRYRKGGQGDDVFVVSRLCAEGSVWADRYRKGGQGDDVFTVLPACQNGIAGRQMKVLEVSTLVILLLLFILALGSLGASRAPFRGFRVL